MDLESILYYSTLVISLLLICLIIAQPRQTQVFSSDSGSQIGRPNYWRTYKILKILTVIFSTCLVFLLKNFGKY